MTRRCRFFSGQPCSRRRSTASWRPGFRDARRKGNLRSAEGADPPAWPSGVSPDSEEESFSGRNRLSDPPRRRLRREIRPRDRCRSLVSKASNRHKKSDKPLKQTGKALLPGGPEFFLKPLAGQAGDLFELARFLEQVGCSGNDLDFVLRVHQGCGFLVHADHRGIQPADDQ